MNSGRIESTDIQHDIVGEDVSYDLEEGFPRNTQQIAYKYKTLLKINQVPIM